MSQPTYSEISVGIAATLETAVGIKVVQEQLSLTEAIADLPCIQVYMEDDAPHETIERTTFKAGVRWNETTWNVDVYAHDRGVIGENIRDVYEYGQAVKDVLNAMKDNSSAGGSVPPFFGVDGIKTYHWRAQRLQIENAAQEYAAMRFILILNLY